MTVDDTRFVEIYDRYHRHVYGYCRRRTPADRVDDAVADTFLTVWRRITEVPEGERCLPWLYGVAFRVLNHQWRGASRRKRLADKLAGLGVQAVGGPDDYIVSREESQQVLRALKQLKSTDQEVLRLSAWEGLSPEDIAVALGISGGAARQRLYEARKNLTKEYSKLERRDRPSPAAQKGGAR